MINIFYKEASLLHLPSIPHQPNIHLNDEDLVMYVKVKVGIEGRQ